MFKVKATVIDFLGDKEKYPCHHGYKTGDEFIYDGESFTGTICPSLIPMVGQKILELHAAGPRYRDTMYYYPFLYAPVSVEDPSLKKYDGLGFRNVLETYTEPGYHMANLASSGFKWPPPEERTAKKDITIMHPGPINRGIELDSDLADSDYSVILNQVTNGVAVRMAVLYLLSGEAE